ncbi:PASTA domain-containing protein [Streptomyces sp. yr375]|uniref:PASTA domain-containing protein n=1 Tax=Streptomyces sp. yr375 TaxID=1761906 RepID=UPI00210EECA6|nr:PASTA domain-containing protein [Streptomyces sp. yr375]
MNRFAHSADAPDFDAPQIVRSARRRRTAGIAAVATALILAGGGTALATSVASSGSSTPAATSEATGSDATTMLYGENPTIPIDFAGWRLDDAKTYLDKTQTKLGTVTRKATGTCKPGSVIGVSPHAPAIVHNGDTVSFVVCAG